MTLSTLPDTDERPSLHQRRLSTIKRVAEYAAGGDPERIKRCIENMEAMLINDAEMGEHTQEALVAREMAVLTLKRILAAHVARLGGGE